MTPDVIVVGGGLMGCSTAYRLAKDGLRVVVLEKSVPGAEASSAAAGILAPSIESHENPYALQLGRRSRELHAELADELDELFGIDIGFRRCGVIRLAFDASEAEAIAEQCESLLGRGVRSEAWNREELLSEEPQCNPEAVSALHVPEEAQVEPRKLLAGVALGAEREGVVFRSGTTVRRIVVEGERAHGVEVDDERIDAARIVVAAGSWTTLIPGLRLRNDAIYPVRGQMLATETRPPTLRRIVFGAGGYVVTRPDGRTLCGSTEERVGFERGITFRGMADIIATARRIAPSLADATVRDHWSSFRPGTPDDLPLVGQTGIEGLLLASGHYRNGILLAPVTAELIAEAIANPSDTPQAQALSPLRFEETSS